MTTTQTRRRAHPDWRYTNVTREVRPVIERDDMDRPGLTHRSLQHMHLPGGGTWLLSATVQADFIHHIIDGSARHIIGPTAIADYWDTFSGVSGGSSMIGGILQPASYSSMRPKYATFSPLRTQFQTDTPSIFDEAMKNGFFVSKLWRGAIGAFADSMNGRFNQADRAMREMLYTNLPDNMAPTSWMGRTAAQTAALQHRIITMMRETTMDGLQWLGDRAVDKTHFDHANLAARLQERLQLTYPDGTIHPLQMMDLVKPVIIPSIRINPLDNSYVRYMNPSNPGMGIEAIDERFRAQFFTSGTVADAALFSSLQNPLFRTSKDQTDGGALYTGELAVFDTKLTRQAGERYGVTIFECNMADHPDFITPKQLERAFLPEALTANFRAQVISRRQHDMMRMVLDPACSMAVEFRRAARPTTIYPVGGPICEELEDFAQEYMNRSYHSAIQTPIPSFSVLSQAASDPATHRLFIDAGIQTVGRMVPEFVEAARRLLRDGPILDITTKRERDAIHDTIEARFPKQYLKAIMATRRSTPDRRPRPHNNLVHFNRATNDLVAEQGPVQLGRSHRKEAAPKFEAA